MYNGSGTVAHGIVSQWLYTGFSRNDVIAAILKVWRHIRNPAPIIEANLLENILAKFHPHPIKTTELGLLSRLSQQEKAEEEAQQREQDVVVISDQSVPNATRQLSYRKEDRAMRPIYGWTEKFWESSLRTRLLFQKFVMDFCSDRY